MAQTNEDGGYKPPAWKPKPPVTKKGNVGTGKPPVFPPPPATPPAWVTQPPQFPQQPKPPTFGTQPVTTTQTPKDARDDIKPTFGPPKPAWMSTSLGPTSFLAGGNTIARTATGASNIYNAQGLTRWVRTGEGTWVAIPWQPGMLTGTFFSGGTPPPTPTSVPTPPAPTFTTPQSGGGYGGYGGYFGGYGGGGGGYKQPKSLLMNLYNWNFKG